MKPVSVGMDLPFTMLVVLIMGIGLIMEYSASFAKAYYTWGNSAHFFTRQAVFALGGIAAMYIISRMNYQYFRGLSIPLIAISVVLLILVLFIGTKLNGSRRWIYIGTFGFQPSEVAKTAIIMCFATMISAFGERMKTFKYGIVPFAAILVIVAGLIAMEPHLSGTILVLATGAALLFVGGVHWGWFAGMIGAGVAGIFAVTKLMPHALSRLSTWQDPFSVPRDEGYQIIQSLYAVGSGGLLGVGLGKSRQKYLYLPEQHNDFIFAVVCEELGFIGAGIVLFLFALLIIRGYWIAIHSHDKFGSILVVGIMSKLALQTFLNVAVVTNLIPTTGISLPFFSYGGTSLMIQLAEMGMVLAVSRQIPAPKSG